MKRRSPLTYSIEYSWISVAMSVTTNMTDTDRPSIWMPIVNLMSPTCHHVHWRITGGTKCRGLVPAFSAGRRDDRAPEGRPARRARRRCLPA